MLFSSAPSSHPCNNESNLNRNCLLLFNLSRTDSSPISLPLTSARVDIYTHLMGPPPPPPSPQPQPPPHAHGLCFFAPSWAAWLRGIVGEHSPNNSWRIDGMEGVGEGGGGPAGLRFLLHFDPGKPGSFDRTLLGFSLSALFSRLLRWSKDAQRRGGGGGSMAAIAAEGGEEDSGNAAVSAAALAAAASLCLAAMYASGQRPRRRRLPAAPSSASRPRALPAPHDGLRILSSKPDDESPENVLHGASIGAGDDEPDIVARVEMNAMPAQVVAVANADDETETEPDHPEEEEEERQELQRLRELWLSLLDREQRLELRLQELEDLRSQEEAATVRELEGRVAAADTDTRLLQLRVSALQEDNGRLRAQVEELDTARAELARAKEKLREVKARLQGEQEEARREVAALRERVAELESGGEERAGALAAEIAELRKANAALEEDNMELALRLQDAEQAASASVNLVPEEGMVEEMMYLRESNQRLTRQIEQLRNDHCAHVEELVYLKWVNACLRHELLRDHDGDHPTTAKQQGHSANRHIGSRDDLSSALELSKSMSFRSSERAKQLMLRYGHPGLDGGFDPTLFSPLHESVDGDGYERSPANNYKPERSPCARSGTGTMMATSPATAPGKKAGPRKLKLLGNIKKLLPSSKRRHSSSHVHGHGHDQAGGHDGRKAAPAPRDEYLEKAMQWLSTHDVLDGDHSYESTPLSSCERTPLSSVTTNTTVDSHARGGGGGHSEHGETARAEAEPILARSKSDAGGAYGREGSSRYHALRPDHPTSEADEPDGFRAPKKREARRRSKELRSPAVA